MKAWISFPKTLLVQELIENFWFLERPQGIDLHTAPKLLPNPSANLIFTPINQINHYVSSSGEVDIKGAHCIGPLSECIMMSHAHKQKFLGLKLRPGALKVFDFSRNNQQLNKITGLPNAFSELSLKANMSSSDPKIVDWLEKELIMIFDQVKIMNSYKRIQQVITTLDSSQSLSTTLPFSRRTLERDFLKYTGFRTSQYLACRKLEKLMTDIVRHGEKEPSWSELAFQHGYSDQSHMIRQVKKALGRTPSAHFGIKDAVSDVYGGLFLKK
ncbi:helix-turn-helix domain-containing protein [Vibrio sp. 10N.261.52.C2]|uniref:helix-turn-helix domain-containing protein n=1 Tax=Vibrio sp. 10N.261.52.C2 TaxID=3229681 RepID=UPI00354C1C0F